MPSWCIDYIDLKLLKKCITQKGYSTPLFYLKAGNKSHVKAPGGRRCLPSPEEFRLEAYVNKPCHFLNYYCKSTFYLDFSLSSKILNFVVLSVSQKRIISLLKSLKDASLTTSYALFLWDLYVHKLKFVSFSPVHLSCVNLAINLTTRF